jgi:hypothetical protein
MSAAQRTSTIQGTGEELSEETATPRCLNCGEAVARNYCPECGQKAGPRLLTIGQLAEDLLNGLFSYDSKFARSARLLLTRPGALTKEYVAGRRAGYLAPFQLYFWVNAIFFVAYGLVFGVSAEATATPLYRTLVCTTVVMAFFLCLAYYGQRRLLIEHLVFSLHVNTFVIVVMMLFTIGWAAAYRLWPQIGRVSVDPYLISTLTVAFLVYSGLAMKTVYRETAFKTACKVIVITVLTIGTEVVLANLFRRWWGGPGSL